jgi:hypothetical protein
MTACLSRRLLIGASLALLVVRPSWAFADPVAGLKAAFEAEVGGSPVPDDRAARALAAGREMLLSRLDRPQAFLFVDRAEDPLGQWVHVAVGDPGAFRWEILGSGRTSTGRRGRFDHYATPIGASEYDGGILG